VRLIRPLTVGPEEHNLGFQENPSDNLDTRSAFVLSSDLNVLDGARAFVNNETNKLPHSAFKRLPSVEELTDKLYAYIRDEGVNEDKYRRELEEKYPNRDSWDNAFILLRMEDVSKWLAGRPDVLKGDYSGRCTGKPATYAKIFNALLDREMREIKQTIDRAQSLKW
jgi:hypothetical protein